MDCEMSTVDMLQLHRPIVIYIIYNIVVHWSLGIQMHLDAFGTEIHNWFTMIYHMMRVVWYMGVQLQHLSIALSSRSTQRKI